MCVRVPFEHVGFVAFICLTKLRLIANFGGSSSRSLTSPWDAGLIFARRIHSSTNGGRHREPRIFIGILLLFLEDIILFIWQSFMALLGHGISLSVQLLHRLIRFFCSHTWTSQIIDTRILVKTFVDLPVRCHRLILCLATVFKRIVVWRVNIDELLTFRRNWFLFQRPLLRVAIPLITIPNGSRLLDYLTASFKLEQFIIFGSSCCLRNLSTRVNIADFLSLFLLNSFIWN